tara:strand:- start:46 stop:291 length:246 start_codon:yes stop_codon:yes gene_type:complete
MTNWKNWTKQDYGFGTYMLVSPDNSALEHCGVRAKKGQRPWSANTNIRKAGNRDISDKRGRTRTFATPEQAYKFLLESLQG